MTQMHRENEDTDEARFSRAIAQAVASAVAPAPHGPRKDADSPLMTPSWTSIVEAYQKEGNGDREMLLALFNAKAKEDERYVCLCLRS